MLVDSHCHLDQIDLTPFDQQLQGIIDNAKAHDVLYMLCVCIDLENFPKILQITKQYPNIKASVGLHPNETGGEDPSVVRLVQLAQNNAIVAIGETGLDYYRSKGDMSWQQDRFRHHIQAAQQVSKPLIVHTRNARNDTIDILKQENADKVGGVIHCFTENWEMAKKALDLNFYISFSGIVTFKNALEIKEVAKKVPLDRMLIETDSPYLAPVPYRGKPNQPAYVHYVAQYIAALRHISFAKLADATSENYFRLFKHHTQDQATMA